MGGTPHKIQKTEAGSSSSSKPRAGIYLTVSRKTKTGQQAFLLLPDNAVIASGYGRAFIFRRVKFLAKANGASGPPP